MTTTRRLAFKRRSAAAASLLLLPLLAACGFGAQTNHQYQSAAGTDNRDGVVQILNAAIVIPHAGATNGIFVGSFVNTSTSDPADQTNQAAYNPGTAATIESISVTTPAGGTVNPMITLAPNTSYNPQPADVVGQHGVPITVPATVTDGGYVTMSFVINAGTAQTVTMQVPVFPGDAPNSFFTKYLPAAPASTAPSAKSSSTKS